jgi:hypothetical protein
MPLQLELEKQTKKQKAGPRSCLRKVLSVDEALKLVKEFATAKFNERPSIAP